MGAIFDLIKEKIQPGAILPKIKSDEIWKVKTLEGTRRGEKALIYQIPNHKNSKKPHEKGINASEWEQAFQQLTNEGEFTLDWFKKKLKKCSEEGNCNYYTIGSIFSLLGIASYGARGAFLKKINSKEKTMLEIRFHGRGGQGAVTSVELLALAAINEGKFAQGFPSFGPERRGAPVLAFLRIDDRAIRLRCKIANPDVVLILDPSLIRIQKPAADLKPDGVIVLNTNKSHAQVREEFGFTHKLALVDANTIAREVLGVPITNTTMLGALIKATGAVAVEAMEEPIKERFGPLAVKNFNALKVAFEKTALEEAKP